MPIPAYYADLLKVSEVELYGSRFTLAHMDEEEVRYFDTHFNIFLGTTDSVLRKILTERKSAIFQGVRALKYDLDNPKFRGLNPADTELGFSEIRPGHVKGWDRLSRFRSTGNVLQDTIGWGQFYPAALTWYDWLFSTSGVGFLTSEDHGLIITHVTSYTNPRPLTKELKFKVGRTELVPHSVSDIILGDNENRVFHMPVPTLYTMTETELLVRTVARADAPSNSIDYLKLGGLTVGLGRFLKRETYAGIW